MARYEVKDHSGTTVSDHDVRKDALQVLSVVRHFSKTTRQARNCRVVAFMTPKNSVKLQTWRSA